MALPFNLSMPPQDPRQLQQNMVPEAAQPPPMPMQLPAQAPGMMPGVPPQVAAGMSMYPQGNPYAAFSGGRESVISDENRQAKLGSAFDAMLQSVVQGADKSSQNQMRGTQLFGGAAAALGGLLGGGYAQGGLQVLQDVNQKVHDAKVERHQQQQEAITGLKALTDIVGTTSPYSQKNLAMQLKGTQAGQKLGIDADRAATSRMRAFNSETFKTRQIAEAERHNKASEGLKQAGLGELAAKRQLMGDIANQKAKLAVQLQQMQDTVKREGYNATTQANMANLAAKYKMFNAAQGRLAFEFQEKSKLMAGRKDKEGNLVYSGADGKEIPLGDMFDLGLVGAEADDLGMALSDPDQEEAQRIQQYVEGMQIPPQQPAQQAASPAPPAAPKAANPQQILGPGAARFAALKQGGASPQAVEIATTQWAHAIEKTQGIPFQQALQLIKQQGY